MKRALAVDPSISQHLGDQMKKLIVDPILTIAEPISPPIIVVDGLDECDGDAGLLQELIHLLVNATAALPFRFLFTSRPEHHILQTFELPPIRRKTYRSALRDSSARQGNLRDKHAKKKHVQKNAKVRNKRNMV